MPDQRQKADHQGHEGGSIHELRWVFMTSEPHYLESLFIPPIGRRADYPPQNRIGVRRSRFDNVLKVLLERLHLGLDDINTIASIGVLLEVVLMVVLSRVEHIQFF